jgi:diacylglycerol kinase family enzyme
MSTSPSLVLVLTNAASGSADLDVVERVTASLHYQGVRTRVHRLSDEQGLDGDGPVYSALEALGDARKHARLVIAGGDGTVHHVVAELHRLGALDPDWPLAVLPMGTGNDLAGGAGLPEDPVAAAQLVVDGQPRRRDLLVDDTGGIVVNAAHVGVGALASERASPLKARLGPLAYPIGAVLAGVSARGWALRVEADDHVLADGTQPLLMVGVAVGARIGGGTDLAPGADPGDGLADVVVASATGPLARAGFARALQVAEHDRRDDVLVTRARTIRVSGDMVPVNCDGELGDETADRTWRVKPAAWALLTPAT